MMLEKSPKIITGILAFLIYFTIVGLIIYYFNTKEVEKPKHFVKKNENRIQVSVSAPKSHIKSKMIKKETKEKKIKKTLPSKNVKEKIKPKPKVKKKVNKKITKAKIIKKPIKKKKEIVKKKKEIVKKKKEIVKKNKKPKITKKTHKVKTSDLFSDVKTKDHSKAKKENKIKTKENKKERKDRVKEKIIKKPTASDKIRNSLKKETKKDKGIENAYFSKVQSLLETWPAQSEFAGEKAIVRISVMPTGKFDFKVQTQSNNARFNQELIAFLKQLQRIGLGRHNAGRIYEFNVEFIAKE